MTSIIKNAKIKRKAFCLRLIQLLSIAKVVKNHSEKELANIIILLKGYAGVNNIKDVSTIMLIWLINSLPVNLVLMNLNELELLLFNRLPLLNILT